MAIADLTTLYPGKADAPDAAYPQGAPRNESAPGANDGTPLDEQFTRDMWGFFNALMVAGGVTPNGTVDTAAASQYLAALKTLFKVFGYLVGSAQDTGVLYDVGDDGYVVSDFTFSTDGKKLFIVDPGSPEAVRQYSVAVPFDINTMTDDAVSFDISAQATLPRGIAFSTDGTKMHVVDQTSARVYQYDLTTGFDLSTTQPYGGVSFDPTAEIATPSEVAFNNDGTVMFVAGIVTDGDSWIFAYTLSGAYDIASGVVDLPAFELSTPTTEVGNLTGIQFNPDGTKLYATGSQNQVRQYGLVSPFDLATIGDDEIFSEFPVTGGPRFNPDGTRMVIDDGSTLRQYATSAVVTP